jgi:hypothetical protein
MTFRAEDINSLKAVKINKLLKEILNKYICIRILLIANIIKESMYII